MSIKKELNKIGEKINSAISDKGERQEECLKLVHDDGKEVNCKGHDLPTMGRMNLDDGKSALDHCIEEYTQHGCLIEPAHSDVL